MAQPLERTLADLGWWQLIEQWAERCHTEQGSARLPTALEQTRVEAEERIAQVSEARTLRANGNPLEFGGITDIDELLARSNKGSVLDAGELLAVADAALGFDQLRKLLTRHEDDAARLWQLGQLLEDLGHVFHPIHEAFGADGRLLDHASDTLGSLRRSVHRLTVKLEEKARSMVDDGGIAKHLQDQFYTQRDDRYVLPVRIESRARVPGIVHGTSQSGQTVFIEPQQLVELNNDLKLAECAVADEERRIYRVLTGYIAEELESLRVALRVATSLDVVDGAARLAEDLSAVAVSIGVAGRIELPAARHPLMELSGKPCVPNNIALGDGQIMVISGPNAGGKTVALKTVGLCALMLRAGLHLPIGGVGELPWFEDVYTEIGDSQNLEQDLSTFSGHLLHLAEILTTSNGDSLVLIDEVAVGTEPEQGAALAQAVLETLVERGVPTIVTTHFEKLKLLPSIDERFVNASVGFDLEAMRPTFRLHMGTPGTSGAIALARRMGLATTIVDRAETLMGAERGNLESMLAELSDARRKLDDERETLMAATAEAKRAALRAEQAENKAKKRKRELENGLHGEGLEALRRARVELEQARTAIKKSKRLDDLKAAGRRVDAASRQLSERAPQQQLPGKPAQPADIVVGASVYVPSLGKRGVVVADPIKGRVGVKVGGLRANVDVETLRIVDGPAAAAKPAAKKTRYSVSQSPATDASSSRDSLDATVDLRGARVDEGLSTLERFIDDSLLQNRGVVCVIHGHGTGAMRRAVREHLAAHPAIASAVPGGREQGGDGVTIATLA